MPPRVKYISFLKTEELGINFQNDEMINTIVIFQIINLESIRGHLYWLYVCHFI